MRFMNENAVRRFGDDTPNLQRAATVLRRLETWTDAHSDGWAYWPKPARAAARLMDALETADRFNPADISAAELTKALAPVKAFLTRQSISHSEVL